MRQFLYVSLCAAVLVGFSTVASAQFGPPDGPYRPETVDKLVEQVQMDLNRGYDQWHLGNGERDRLNNAEKQLRAFAHDWEHAKFDKDTLDHSINAVQKVLNDNHLSGPARDALWNDVEQLRHMREAYDRHEIGRW